jgi:hypothetical protein
MVLIGIGMVLLMAIVLVAVFFALGGIGRPILWEVPAGYRGWASIRYEDPACPPLSTRGLFLVLSAIPDGHGCTSSRPPRPVWRYFRLEYVYPDGTRSRGKLSTGHFDDLDKKLGFFFVGTEEELRRDRGPRR